ncbi:MAG: hypothetical protein NVS2B7_26730 [Herpetosiphon sp.]
MLVQRLQSLLPAGVDFAMMLTSGDADFARHAADADVLLVLHRRIDAQTLALAPRVRFVQRGGVGYGNLDVAALSVAGVVVAYTQARTLWRRRAYDHVDAGAAQALDKRRAGHPDGTVGND